jgi:hypothetical protein
MFVLPFRLKGFHRLDICVTTNKGNTAYDEKEIFIILNERLTLYLLIFIFSS